MIKEGLRSDNPDEPEGGINRGAGIVKRFLAFQPGDLVVSPDGDRLFVGRVTGDAHWKPEDPTAALRRDVEWLNLEAPGSRAHVQQVAPKLFRSLKTLLTVSDLTAHLDVIIALAEGIDDLAGGVDGGPMPPPDGLGLLAEKLTMDLGELERVIGLLERKKQVIFYGPPGTGKTFVALELAKHLTGTRARVTLVQFHASYSYEDFVEGFRPTVEDGQPGFRISKGPLRELAARAETDPDNVYILVIDELNRGNVAKVFGELYFLLEYREEAAKLQYSGDDFWLPDNVLVIGTMNTADRTIALLDAALRRRFYFVPFFPGRPPVNDLLRRWLAKRKPDLVWVSDVVERANAELGNAHVAIGHSYFVDEGLDDAHVREVWEHAILPTIEEYFFGQPERLKAFNLDRLRAAGELSQENEDVAGEEGEGGDDNPP